jgi:hypothetical protein
MPFRFLLAENTRISKCARDGSRHSETQNLALLLVVASGEDKPSMAISRKNPNALLSYVPFAPRAR